ncbi:MAG: DMT family transporter [Spirochaetales bacterium]|nr:DMT family transporter [Spirochaetales bacterium]
MNNEKRAVVMALGAVALWSTVAVAFKLALRELSSFDLVALSSLFSWLSLAIAQGVRKFALKQQRSGFDEDSGKLGLSNARFQTSQRRFSVFGALILGLLNPVLYYIVLFAAYDRLPAQVAQPLNYTWPIFLALLAAPLAKRIPTGREMLGLGLSLLGVFLVAWRPHSGGSLDTLGIVLALGSGGIWALYWLLGGKLTMDGGRRLLLGFTAAIPVLLGIWWARGAALPQSVLGWIMVIWVGLFEMGVTFLLWNGALEHTERPARVGNLVYLGPFVSLLWISIFLKEQIFFTTVCGLLVIILGIILGRGKGLRKKSSAIKSGG